LSATQLSPHRTTRLPRLARVERRRERVGMRVLRGALWVVGVVAGVAVVSRPTLAEEGLGGLDAKIVLNLVVGWSFMASGLVGWARRPENRIGALMVATGLLWFAPELLSQSASSVPFTLGVWIWNAWAVALVLLLLAFPTGRLAGGRDRLLVAAVFVPAIPMQALWLVFLQSVGGPANAFLIWPDADAAATVDTAQRVIALASFLVLLAVLVRRWLVASPPLRRLLTPVVAGAAAILLFGLVIVLDKVGGRTVFLDDLFRVILVGVPIAFLIGILRARLARWGIGDLVVELREPRPPEAVREAIGRALGDPSLDLAYWVPEYAAYVGADGRPIELPSDGCGRVTTRVDRGGRRVAALVHDASLRDEPELVGAVCAAAGIALDNARLEADLRARLEELRGSRARIVEVSDTERRRLERNLHDGAQQRLVCLSIELRLLASRLPGDSHEGRILAAAREELATSLEELRELAKGLHPAVLSDHGLPVALETLATNAPLPVRLTVDVPDRLPEPVEVAAYYFVAETLTNVAKYAHASAVGVDVSHRDGRLVVQVADDGVGGADPSGGSGLRGLADRVEALGGCLFVTSRPGEGTTVQAEIVCA
jgi:signal transduction histidine kinase